MLVFSTLSVWLREAGIAHETINFTNLINLTYTFKFPSHRYSTNSTYHY